MQANNGIAHLVLPAAPKVVTAWKWIPITTGFNGSTIQTTAGGQKANVTIYWQTTYIGLSGSELLLPLQNNINITLRSQQPNYWVLPPNVDSRSASSGGPSSGNVANQPSGVPSLTSADATQGSSQCYLPPQIPAAEQAIGSSVGTQPGPSVDTTTIATAVFVLAALAVVFFATRYRLHRPPSPME